MGYNLAGIFMRNSKLTARRPGRGCPAIVKTTSALIILCVLAGTQTGCDSTNIRRTDFSYTALGQASFEQSYAAGEKVMRNQFGAITIDEPTKTIESKPTYFQQDAPGLGQANYRRRARLMFVRQRKQWWAYLQVLTERSDTQVYRQFQGQRRGLEHAVPTPMESDLTANPSQRQVWTKISRDRPLEMQILSRLRQELGLAAPPSTE
jgi:hypothetical protein